MLKLLFFWIRFIIQHVSVERDLDTSETHIVRGLLWSWALEAGTHPLWRLETHTHRYTDTHTNTHIHHHIKLIQACAYVTGVCPIT